MTVYVDDLMSHGWRMHGRKIKNCHLFTDERSLEALHAMAAAIGLKRAWFQDSTSAPHYDLTPSKRALAILSGAKPVDRWQAVAIWRERRLLIQPELALK